MDNVDKNLALVTVLLYFFFHQPKIVFFAQELAH